MKLAFRVDASASIGLGHVMRCLTLADTFCKMGMQCLFICRHCPPGLKSLLQSRFHQVIMLPSHEENVLTVDAEDAHDTIASLAGISVDWIIVDSYRLGETWEAALTPYCKHLMAIDDLANRKHECDWLLDQNLGRSEADYAQLLKPGHSTLLGTRFALLRPEFLAMRQASLEHRVNPSLKQILISMGGMDEHNVTGRILTTLRDCSLPADCNLRVVLGSDAPWQVEIQAACLTMPWHTELSIGVSNMAAVMAKSDLAITAAGTTLWELCCLGVPMLAVITAENQRHSATALAATGAAALIAEPNAISTTLPKLMVQCAKSSALVTMSLAARAVTDGRGSARVAQEMMHAA